jgi:hypothetical protein
VAAGSLLINPLIQVILVLKKLLLLLFVLILGTGRVLAAARGLALGVGDLAAGLHGNSSSGSVSAVVE